MEWEVCPIPPAHNQQWESNSTHLDVESSALSTRQHSPTNAFMSLAHTRFRKEITKMTKMNDTYPLPYFISVYEDAVWLPVEIEPSIHCARVNYFTSSKKWNRIMKRERKAQMSYTLILDSSCTIAWSVWSFLHALPVVMMWLKKIAMTITDFQWHKGTFSWPVVVVSSK